MTCVSHPLKALPHCSLTAALQGVMRTALCVNSKRREQWADAAVRSGLGVLLGRVKVLHCSGNCNGFQNQHQILMQTDASKAKVTL